ncbi:chromate transporter [Paenibacillus sp. CC-CFT747]|nr:chromate transporter [Paenibacillus sp. CC-CFT747]
MIALSYMYVTLSGIPKVAAAFQGIQCAIVAMIALAGYRMGKQALRDKTTVGLFVLAIALLLFSNLHPMFFIAGGALAGWGAARLKAAKGEPIDFEEQSSGYVDEYGNHYKYSDYFIGDGI